MSCCTPLTGRHTHRRPSRSNPTCSAANQEPSFRCTRYSSSLCRCSRVRKFESSSPADQRDDHVGGHNWPRLCSLSLTATSRPSLVPMSEATPRHATPRRGEIYRRRWASLRGLERDRPGAEPPGGRRRKVVSQGNLDRDAGRLRRARGNRTKPGSQADTPLPPRIQRCRAPRTSPIIRNARCFHG